MRVISRLTDAIRTAARYNADSSAAPACILWPDETQQWAAVVPRLSAEMPELFVLGDYAPEKRTGPAIWLRCVIAGALPEVYTPGPNPPVLYLPGVSRQTLRHVSECPENLQPLVELQYRGVFWSQENAKDWTLGAFFKTQPRGLGLEMADDQKTRDALSVAIRRLLDVDVETLATRRLDAEYLYSLVSGDDPVGDLLLWMDNPEAFMVGRDDGERRAFSELMKKKFQLNPETQGVLTAAEKLARHEGPWKAAWKRFCEAPQRTMGIPDRIRGCRMPDFGFLPEDEATAGWPQYNDEREQSLEMELQAALKLALPELRKKILELEQAHRARRGWVWSQLGQAQLACALAPLVELAKTTEHELSGSTLEELAQAYREGGVLADAALIRALQCIEKESSVQVVSHVISALYTEWADAAARTLQRVWRKEKSAKKKPKAAVGREFLDCVVFVDGLRYDCALRLAELLKARGLTVQTQEVWAGLPSVTGTGKPMVAPGVMGSSRLKEDPSPTLFEPMTAYQLQQSITDAGYQMMNRQEMVTTSSLASGKLWMEFGSIDHEGHDRQARLVRHLDRMLEEIVSKVEKLVRTWEKIQIVTDHGWLLLPGGLPKVKLDGALAAERWQRCALIKENSKTQENQYPWEWNPKMWIALPEGIACYSANQEYAHGGLSLQECLLLELVVSSGGASAACVKNVKVTWKQLVCRVQVEGAPAGCTVDLRKSPGDENSSVLGKPVGLDEQGRARLIVLDEDLEGQKVWLVVLDAQQFLYQVTTTIGGES